MEPSLAALDLDFIEPASSVFDTVKEAIQPELVNFVAVAFTGAAAAIIIRSLTGGK